MIFQYVKKKKVSICHMYIVYILYSHISIIIRYICFSPEFLALTHQSAAARHCYMHELGTQILARCTMINHGIHCVDKLTETCCLSYTLYLYHMANKHEGPAGWISPNKYKKSQKHVDCSYVKTGFAPNRHIERSWPPTPAKASKGIGTCLEAQG